MHSNIHCDPQHGSLCSARQGIATYTHECTRPLSCLPYHFLVISHPYEDEGNKCSTGKSPRFGLMLVCNALKHRNLKQTRSNRRLCIRRPLDVTRDRASCESEGNKRNVRRGGPRRLLNAPPPVCQQRIVDVAGYIDSTAAYTISSPTKSISFAAALACSSPTIPVSTDTGRRALWNPERSLFFICRTAISDLKRRGMLSPLSFHDHRLMLTPDRDRP